MTKDKANIAILTPVNIIGFILAMMAGWVDAVGIKLFIHERCSFMSGRGAILGAHILDGDIKTLIGVIIIIISFITGAYIATIITKNTNLTGGLLFAGILILIAAFTVKKGHLAIATIIIPMAMGGQNASTSLTAIGRTTHLTGPATDIGISIAENDWNTTILWTLRWVGFPLGSVIGLHLVNKVTNNMMNTSITLLLPAIIIVSTGIIQKFVFNIPLLDKDR